MKKNIFFATLFFFLGMMASLYTFSVHAQISGGAGGLVGTATECNNNKDDDSDGTADYIDGVVINGKTYKKDLKCITRQTPCEDGTLRCVTSKDNTAASQNKDGFMLDVHFDNPLQVNSIEEAVKKIMDVIIMIAIPVIIVMFIWAGFMYVFAQGDPNAIKKAHNIFLYTLLGALLILGAWTIAAAVVGTVNLITG